MALPPVVIVDRLSPGLMLGATGWTTIRAEALSFPSVAVAFDWIASERKVTPALYRDHDAAPEEREQRQDEAAGGVRTMQDYDPLLGAA